MSKRVSIRGIIIEGNEVYTVFRRKFNNFGTVKEYYVIHGGEVGSNETIQETLK